MSDNEKKPLSKRAAATRAALMTAGRHVFETHGFLTARVADIVTEAGVSQGSFYNYWDSKEGLFLELFTEVESELLDGIAGNHDGFEGSIRAGITSFVTHYRDHAPFLLAIEQVATFHPEIQARRMATRHATVERISASIRGYQRNGLADPTLDANCVAKALLSMVGHFTYMWQALGEHEDFHRAIDTLTRLWILSLNPPARAKLD